LSNLLVSRDNVRQAIFDLLLLEKAIASMDIDGDGDADFDSTNISFVGHSLGAMVGTGFIAYSDLIKTAALAFPGGAIAELLSNSDSFGPKIKAGVAASAGIDVTDSAFPDILASFNFAAQMVLDSGDPANYAAMVVTNDVPTLMLQVLDDTVVPNSAATAPLAGTEPLARLMGLSTVTTDTAGILEGNRLFTKLNMGNHGSVISPADGDNSMGLLNVTTEIQTQIVTFFATSGTAIEVVDPTLLDD
ncbi:MAG: hypothetical protein GY829_13000, partial [Gammaproteobacteria bacterium]|nr:hypothetical protein [Gammaproteobacteria bacterium]